jgi:transcriptional antiterminator
VRKKEYTTSAQEVVVETIQDMTTGARSEDYVTSTEICSECEAVQSTVERKLKAIRGVLDNVEHELQTDPRPRYVYWWDNNDSDGGVAS